MLESTVCCCHIGRPQRHWLTAQQPHTRTHVPSCPSMPAYRARKAHLSRLLSSCIFAYQHEIRSSTLLSLHLHAFVRHQPSLRSSAPPLVVATLNRFVLCIKNRRATETAVSSRANLLFACSVAISSRT